MERRTFLTGTGAIGAGTLLSALTGKSARGALSVNDLLSPHNGSLRAGYGAKPLRTESDDLTPYDGSWGDAQLRHLLRRSMFGVPESQFIAAQALGSMSAVVAKLLEASALPAKLADWVDNYPQSGLSQVDQMNQTRLMSMERQQIENWWFDLIVKENLSIRQKMTLLWTNHFVTGSQTVSIPGYIYYYLITCMENALGNFKDFTSAISTSSAMLNYLNGDQNYDNGKRVLVNENFARELMELFTLGIFDLHVGTANYGNPNYTETDIQNSARALTGWQHSNKGATPVAPFTGVLWDGTNGNPNYHDTTNKTFLGQTGNFGLQDILNIIFQQGNPAGYTAAYWVCQKLYQEFVYYVPNPNVIDAMATKMLDNNFDIAPVMSALLSSAHFYDASVIGAQIKSPVEYAGSLVREFGLTYTAFDHTDPPIKSTDGNGNNTYTNPNPALSVITTTILNTSQGQQLLNPPNVKGWPGGENWLSAGTFQGRENYSSNILNNLYINTKENWSLAFDADVYSAQIQNSALISAEELSQALEDLSLAFTLGAFESGDLDTDIQGTYKNPKYQYNTLGVKNFALYLVTLPEFQLY